MKGGRLVLLYEPWVHKQTPPEGSQLLLFPGCVRVARQTLDLLVGVRILPGERALKKGFFYRAPSSIG